MVTLDTVNVNKASVNEDCLKGGGLRPPVWIQVQEAQPGDFGDDDDGLVDGSRPPMIECQQHVINLMVKDLKGCGQFEDVFRVCSQLSVWLRESPARLDALAAGFAKIGLPSLRPLRGVPTRFLTDVLVICRMEKLLLALDAIDDSVFSDAKPSRAVLSPRATFRQLRVDVQDVQEEISAISDLFQCILVHSPRLGSQNAYTASLPPVFFFILCGPLFLPFRRTTRF